MEIKATLQDKVSKNGNSYTVVVLKLTDNYEKQVFLEKSEIELLKMQEKKNNPFGK